MAKASFPILWSLPPLTCLWGPHFLSSWSSPHPRHTDTHTQTHTHTHTHSHTHPDSSSSSSWTPPIKSSLGWSPPASLRWLGISLGGSILLALWLNWQRNGLFPDFWILSGASLWPLPAPLHGWGGGSCRVYPRSSAPMLPLPKPSCFDRLPLGFTPSPARLWDILRYFYYSKNACSLQKKNRKYRSANIKINLNPQELEIVSANILMGILPGFVSHEYTCIFSGLLVACDRNSNPVLGLNIFCPAPPRPPNPIHVLKF